MLASPSNSPRSFSTASNGSFVHSPNRYSLALASGSSMTEVSTVDPSRW